MLAGQSFKLQPLPRIVFGVGSAAYLGAHVRTTGKDAVLVVTDKGVVAAGISDRVVAVLTNDGFDVAVYDAIDPNPTADNVYAGGDALRALGDAAVVSVGGGSALDAAKIIALQGPNGGAVADFHFGCKPARPGQPVIAIPTTAGTGSETNMFALITDTAIGRKLIVGHPSTQASIAILDPELTVGLPPYQTATCGFDAMTHAIEAYTSKGANPYADGVALHALRLIRAFLPRAFKDGTDIEARSQMMLAASMAAMAFNATGLGVCHGTGHPLSARFSIPHGQTLATMLPAVMEFNLETSAERYAEIAHVFGVARDEAPALENARAAREAVLAISNALDLAKPLSELGVSPDSFAMLADDALADITTHANPRDVSHSDALALYASAYE